MDYTYLLWVALILSVTKFFGVLVRKIALPEVVGFLVAGILLGPSVLHLVTMNGDNGVFLQFSAEFGVIFLMFDAGLTTDIDEMKKNALASFVVAVLGVVVPLVCGTLVYSLYFHQNLANYQQFLQALFIGVILTATSVSITVQTLKELGHLSGRVGTTILGAAVIDDILGIVVLTVVSSLKGSPDGIALVFGKILIYAIMIAILGFFMTKGEPLLKKYTGLRRSAIFAFSFAFALAFVSEALFGITDITGAYFAGLMMANSAVRPYISQRVSYVTNMFFGAIFFACIGIKVSIGDMSPSIWLFAVILTIVAVLTKLIGCGLGAFCNRFNKRESLQIAVGMISRGEVALIVAEKGRQLHLLSAEMFGPVVLVVIATTLITPILLKLVFSDRRLLPKGMHRTKA